MIEDRDVWRAALLIGKRYGDDALLEVSVWAVAAAVHGVDGRIRDFS
jgi:hypothetical protein